MKKLYILRHGKSDYPEGVSDHDRPLNKRGQKASILIGKYLKLGQITPEYILSSDSTRTSQTIQNASKEANLKTKIEFSGKMYLATPGEILKELARVDNEIDSVMIVCHNPGAELLTATLAADGNPDALHNIKPKYPTCGLASITLKTDSWKKIDPCCGFLDEFVTPKILGKI